VAGMPVSPGSSGTHQILKTDLIPETESIRFTNNLIEEGNQYFILIS